MSSSHRQTRTLWVIYFGLMLISFTPLRSLGAEGFVNIQDAQLSAPVRRASKAVFKIWYDSPYSVSGAKYFSTYATGFLLEQGDTVVTVRHLIDSVIDDWLKIPDHQKILRDEEVKSGSRALTQLVRSGKIPMKFRITDQNGNQLFSNQANEQKIEVITYFDPSAFLQDIYHPSLFWSEIPGDSVAYQRIFSDTVVLRLSQPLMIEPLHFRELQAEDSQLFEIGFPSLTKNREQNSDGVSMYVATGSRIGTQEAQAKAGRKKMLSNKQSALLEQAAFYTSIDAIGGNSGSPIFADDGSVVGMAAAIPGLKVKTDTGGYRVVFDVYTGAGALVVSAPWIGVLRSLNSIESLQRFQNSHRTLVDRFLLDWTSSTCLARMEKQELSLFLKDSLTNFESKNLILNNITTANFCTSK